ncbi:MAG TPA: oligosaccharide flippase family protein [Jatrophihabitans sp.]|uniref:oligosaccharide flippase family protein n=1 Tax=Jatrophihabitans sp. TaxID=1932789 RepID=UPI002E02DF40|nr:oligosaccharide flippase family protein [Jatrophihabitans sp.]
MTPDKRSMGRQLSVITVDQIVAGASNVLIAVLAARLLGVASFGLFGIVFLVYVLLQGISRALVSDPLLVHPEEAQDRPGDAIGTSILIGLGLGVVLFLASFGAGLWEARLGDALLVLAVCTPLLVLQDFGRYLGFARQRPSSAMVLDTVWLVLVCVAVALLLAFDARTLTWFVVAWAGSGAVAGVLVFVQVPVRAIRLDLSWLRSTWPFSWRYLISYTTTQGSALAASSGVGGIAGPRALGGMQGAVLLVRPFMTLQVAAVAAGVSSISRLPRDDARIRTQGIKISVLAVGVAALNTIVMLALPDRLGVLVLGASWTAAKPLLLPTGVQILLLAVITGARAGLLGTRAVSKAMVLDVAATVLVLGLVLVGAFVGGVSGALWAVAAGQGVAALGWWLTIWGHTRPSVPTPGGRHRPEFVAALTGPVATS